MKKFGAIFLSIFALFAGCFLSACGEEGKIEFTQSYLAVYKEQKIELEDYIKLTGLDIKDVEFKSLDTNIVAVSNNNVASAQNAGTTLIVASCGNIKANLEIEVVGDAVKANAPDGLRYDEKTGNVVWNPQIVKLESGVKTIGSYDVVITKNGTTTTQTVVGDNKIAIEGEGEYIIKVKSNGLTVDGVILYNDSEYSSELSLTKLPSPYNVKYNDQTKMLTWEADNLCTSFRVRVNGVVSDVVSEKQMALTLAKPNQTSQEVFEISVISYATESGKTLVSSESEKISLTRLYAPQMTISGGVISWDNTQQGDFHYEITRQSEGGAEATETVSGGTYTLTGLAATEYNTITIRAVADSESYLSSENQSKLENVVKLAPTILSFDTTKKQISATNYEGKNIELSIKYKNNTETITLENGVYNWNKTNAGTYEISAVVYAQNTNEINSDISNTISITQLPKVSNIVQSVDQNNNYIISYDEVDGEDISYDFSYGLVGEEKTGLIGQDGNFGNANAIFSQTGKYQVVVGVSSTKKLENNVFVLPSQTVLEVVRHPDVEISKQTNADSKVEAITWNVLDNVLGYGYVIEKDGEAWDNGTISGNQYSTTNFQYGRYLFKLKALGMSNTDILYLDSLNYAETTFNVEYNLQTPTLNFDRETKILTITKVQHATNYEIKINNADILFDNTQSNITIDLDSRIVDSGVYTITVVAKNTDDELVLDSTMGQIQVVKHASPQNFTLTADGLLIITDYPNAITLDDDREDILINGQATSSISSGNTFEVKAKFNSKKTRLGSTYYVDSEYSTFTIERVDSSQKPVLSGTKISWTPYVADGFSYALHIYQNGLETTINLDTNEIDVFDEKLANVDLDQDFSVAVEYKFSGTNITLPLTQSQKYSSLISEMVEIKKLKSDVQITAIEQNKTTTLSWTQSEEEGVNYELYIDDVSVYTGTNSSFETSTHFSQEKTYTVKLKISKQGFLTSSYAVIYVERLKSVENITISEDETISVETSYNSSYSIVGGNGEYSVQKNIQLEKILITNNDTEITNLSSLSGMFDVSVQLIAKQYTTGAYFYLSSGVTTFSFNRMTAPNPPQINDNQISWDTVAEIETYQLKFTANDNQQTLDVSGNNISVFDEKVENILNTLNSSTYNVSIKTIVGEFTASSGQSYILSSPYSTNSEMLKLEQVSDISVTVSDTNFKQDNITISWSHNARQDNVSEYIVEILNEGKLSSLQTVSGTTKTLSLESAMLKEGKWSVRITANGTGNAINSEPFESAEYLRLSAPTALSIDKNALLSWTGVALASSYVVYYYHNDEITGTLTGITQTSYTLSSELASKVFDGQITIQILAVGGKGIDEAKTFSSAYSEALIAQKTAKATLQLDTDSIKVVGEEDNDLSYTLTIKTDNRVVKTVDLKNNEVYTFEDWYYADTKEKVPTNINKTYVFEVVTQSTKENTLYSDINSISATKLKTIQNVGFYRDTQIDALIHLRGNKVDNASRYVLSLDTLVTDAFNLSGDYIDLAVSGDFEKALTQTFTLSIYAQGEIGGANGDFINSSETVVSGTKLPTITKFIVEDGVLTWNKIENATDYNIRVSDTEILSGYVANSVHTLTENLTGKVGSLSVNIKAVGNVGTSLVSNNIVLDGSYLRNDTNELENYQIYKLEKPTALQVIDGYVAFTFTQNANKYKAVVGDREFSITQVDTNNDEIKKMYSEALYDALTPNTAYTLSVYATSYEDDTMYSDKTDTINIKILDNATKNTLKISQKVKSENPLLYDYSVSQLTWTADASAINGYNVNINGEVTKTNLTTYVLDPEDKLKSGQNYGIRVAVAGSNGIESDGYYYLSSKYSEQLSFTKLQTPTPSLNQGLLSWTRSEGANGYIIYLDGKQFNDLPITTLTDTLDLGSMTKNQVYSTYEVRAISTSSTAIASSLGLYTKTTEGGNKAVEITKMKAPQPFTVNNGELIWEVSSSELLKFATNENGASDPFTAKLSTIQNAKINIKMTYKNTSADYILVADAGDFVYCDDDTKNTIKSLASLAGFDADQIIELIDRPSWPSLTYNYQLMGEEIPAGSYYVSLKQIGDNSQYVSSNYGAMTEVYIPYAPQIEVKYSESAGFVLTWNAITIPSQYSTSNVEYIVVGETKNVVTVRGKTQQERIVLATTTSTSLNLTDLINADEPMLTEEFTNIYVYVKGNNDKVLNGKLSNQIKLKVLEETTASVHNGELVWNAQLSASGYNVFYYPNEDASNQQCVFVSEPKWDAKELSSQYDYYNIHIQAVGVRLSSKIEVTLTGKLTYVGKISKLATPQTSVEDGVFVWSNIDNSTSYKVTAYNGAELASTAVVGSETGKTLVYESIINGNNIKYFFQAIGSLDVSLAEDVLAYVNSDIDSGKYATVIPTVTGVKAKDGVLTWDIARNNGIEVLDYKLTFVRIDENGVELNDPIIIINNNFKQSVSATYCSYDCSALVETGLYNVYVQAYISTADTRGKYTYNNETAYYLISIKSQEYHFTKYDKVENINIVDGIITWDYSGEVPQNPEDITYRYKLTFTTNTGNGNEDFVYYTEKTQFSSYIVENLEFRNPFTINIQVVPKKDVLGYVNSDNYTYVDELGAIIENYQVRGVLTDEIFVIKPQDQQDLFISWEDYETGVSGLKVVYLVRYWNSKDDTVQTKQVSEKRINTADLEFSVSDAYTLYYQIQVIPQGDANYLPSYIQDAREIQKPKALSIIYFNSVSQTFYWDVDASSQDHSYKIRDQIIEIDEDGNAVVDQDGNYVVLRTYLFTTQNASQNEYAPIEQGMHLVSVAVVVKNAQSEGSLTSSYTFYYNGSAEDRERGSVVKINLFAEGSGIGTEASPYLISTKQHFANIIYRANKFEYQNSYVLRTDEGDTSITYTSTRDKQYNFKQTAELIDIVPFATDATMSFYGGYDGNYQKLTWTASLADAPSRGVVSLFDTLEASAEIKNLNVFVKLTNTTVSTIAINLSGIANINNGIISNVKIGEVGQSLQILNTRKTLNVAMVANTNKGTITKAVNYYAVTLSNVTASSGFSLGFGGVAYVNDATISYSANYASFNLTSANVAAGGIVAINSRTGLVDGCVYKAGTLSVDLNNTAASSLVARVGGIVGQNNQGAISHSYSTTELKVTKAAITTNIRVNVGGLVGATTGTNITYSYVNVTRNANSISDGVYQIVGAITSPTLSGDTCFYKAISTFLSGGDNVFVPQTYTTSISKLNGNGVYFNETVTQAPDLIWERQFTNDWDANTNA